MNVYLISGLGVDRRIFQKLQWPPGFSVHYIDWILPEEKESIGHYAWRLSAVIDVSQPFVLVGMSFGGMMAVEINKIVRPAKTIIVSTASVRKELPPYFRWVGAIRLHAVVPTSFLKKPNPVFHWLFGIHTPEEKKLFKSLLQDADPRIIRWSIDAVVNWKNTEVPQNLHHIHGTADVLLPVCWARPNIAVKGGEHFMIFSRAGEVSAIIGGLLEK